MSQQMVLSPQLQQSLALLQAPVLELKAMVEQELQQNPMLEEASVTETTQEEKDSRSDDAAAQLDPQEPPADTQYDPATEKPDSEPVDQFDADLQKLLDEQKEGDGFKVSKSALTLTATIPGIEQAKFDELAHAAEVNCPISKVLNAEITLKAALSQG